MRKHRALFLHFQESDSENEKEREKLVQLPSCIFKWVLGWAYNINKQDRRKHDRVKNTKPAIFLFCCLFFDVSLVPSSTLSLFVYVYVCA